MKQVAQGLDHAALRTGREAERQLLRAAAAAAGGPSALVRERYPYLGALCPADWSEEALVAQTVAWYEDCEARLVTCAKCPPAGAACARERMLLKPGQLPVWQGDRIITAPCERYRKWRLSERLAVSNVPERYRGCTIDGFHVKTDAQQLVRNAVVAFFESLQAGEEPWLILSGPVAEGKTHLACAMLRSVPRAMPRKHFWYSDMNELRMQMKNYNFESREESPMDRLIATEVLVLDNMDATRLRLPKDLWLKERVEDVLYQRWNRKRATLITTHETKEAIVGTFPAITTLREAPSCALV
jgi:DNA replication protein DnaC